MADVIAAGTTLLQVLLFGTLLLGVRRRNASIGANALLALTATFLPTLVVFGLEVSRDVQVSIDGIVPFWIATAGCLHVVGIWGWYEARWWWDHVTHVVSAGLIAAVVYGSVHGIAAAAPTLQLSPGVVGGLTLLFTLAIGVFWELVELVVHRYSRALGVEAVLVPYGRRDAAFDLGFDVVGVIAVLWFDVRMVDSVAQTVPSLTQWFLLSVGGFVVAGSVGAILLLVRRPQIKEREA